MKKLVFASLFLVLPFFASPPVYAHCQIPCGIYGDEMRFGMIEENVVTIEKSMKQIVELSKAVGPNSNQIARWVNNKETHADDIRDIVTQYFLMQRVKPVGEKDLKGRGEYVKKLIVLHEMLVYAMKAKQTTDLSSTEKLRSLLSEFRGLYLGSEGKK
jgi:hypothetical protein